MLWKPFSINLCVLKARKVDIREKLSRQEAKVKLAKSEYHEAAIKMAPETIVAPLRVRLSHLILFCGVWAKAVEML